MTKTEALKKVLAIDGWLTGKEASELYDFGRCATGPIVEIGSWKGRSTAALALGAMAGTKQRVYTIDTFKGTPGRPSGNAVQSGERIGPDILRRNLDTAGVNGCVEILTGDSAELAESLPKPSLVFVDGNHDAVKRDILAYADRIADDGTMALHDWKEPGVYKAIEETVSQDRRHWIQSHTTDDLYVTHRRRSTENHSVMLAMPGGSIQWTTVIAVLGLSSSWHQIEITNSGNGFDDLNAVWCNALNAAQDGRITHFVQVHSDIAPQGHFVDLLIDELDRHGLDMVSAVAPIKDSRGLTSAGIGDPANPWSPWKRFTMQEICDLPVLFRAGDAGYDDWPLLHNTGCFACDLRNPRFFENDENGVALFYFDFPSQVFRNLDGSFGYRRESEDWWFSRRLHEQGMKTAITRKVRLTHRGTMDYNNWEPWGSYQDGDKDTSHKWKKENCRG